MDDEETLASQSNGAVLTCAAALDVVPTACEDPAALSAMGVTDGWYLSLCPETCGLCGEDSLALLPGALESRTTESGCACLESWTHSSYEPCSDYCCNPDDDAGGEWCFVEDEECQGANWGYCAPALSALACWEAHLPSFGRCGGYHLLGYTCSGDYCAAVDPGGDPGTCAGAAPAGWVLHAPTGRCAPPGC